VLAVVSAAVAEGGCHRWLLSLMVSASNHDRGSSAALRPPGQALIWRDVVTLCR
jgi:hypothetical protein